LRENRIQQTGIEGRTFSTKAIANTDCSAGIVCHRTLQGIDEGIELGGGRVSDIHPDGGAGCDCVGPFDIEECLDLVAGDTRTGAVRLDPRDAGGGDREIRIEERNRSAQIVSVFDNCDAITGSAVGAGVQ
jgi:hypothetical protein